MIHTTSFGAYALLVFAISGMYVHYRGRIRKRPFKQITDHSTFMAPVNCFIYFFSKVPSAPYLSLDAFPELELLRKNWKIIREEALNLDDQQRIVALEGHQDAGFNSFFRTGWKRFYLKWYGNDLRSARTFCPKTCALLDEIPGVKAAMFASLPPGARLVAHRDPYAGSLRYHLGLEVPGRPECAIHVDGLPYIWQNGEGVMFDETYIHYAENRTDQRRIVLFCDVRRPLWFAPARWLEAVFARVVIGAAVSRNTADDRIGLLNRLFSRLYKVRVLGKALKARSRALYYVVKFTLFGVFIYVIFF